MTRKSIVCILSVLLLVSIACSMFTPKKASPASTAASTTQASPDQQEETNPEAVPTWEPSVKNLKSEQVQPSSESQTLDSGQGLAVILPGGLLGQPQEVSISQVKGKIPTGLSGLKTLAIYDIKVGEQVTFTQPLAIEYTFDPSVLDSTRPAEDQLFAQVWDASSQTWTLLDVTVDPARNVARIETDHLCPVSFNTLDTGQVWTETDHFYIYYWPSDVSLVAGNYKRKSTDLCTHPDFVCDAGDLLEKAYATYKSKDYPFPDKKIYVFLRNNDDSETKALTKAVRIALNTWQDYDALRSAIGHELFHVSQITQLGIATCSARKWWIEATADYAGDRVAFDPERTNQMGVDIKPRYLSSALDSTLKFHDYSTSHFIDYLVSVENVSTFDFLWSSSAQSKQDNMLVFLDQFLRKRTETGLDTHYESFALFYLFDPESPIRNLSTNIDAVSIIQDTYTGKPESKVVSLVGPKISAHLLRIDSDTARFLSIGMWDPAEGDRTFIYQFFDDPLTEDDTPTPLFELVKSKPVAVMYVNANDPLYILVFNPYVIDRRDVGVVIESSDVEMYSLTLKFDDSESDCAQQAASGFGHLFLFVNHKKGTVKVAYDSRVDDYYWSEGAEHTVSISGSGTVKEDEMTGSFSGSDSLYNGDRGSMSIDASFIFNVLPETPFAWNGTVTGSASVKMPALNEFQGLDCTASLGAKDMVLYPANKQP